MLPVNSGGSVSGQWRGLLERLEPRFLVSSRLKPLLRVTPTGRFIDSGRAIDPASNAAH